MEEYVYGQHKNINSPLSAVSLDNSLMVKHDKHDTGYCLTTIKHEKHILIDITFDLNMIW